MNYPRAIRTVLGARQMTQRDLAQEMDVSESYISKLGTEGYTPSGNTLNKIAKVLGVPVYLLVLLASDAEDLKGMSMEQASALGSQLLDVLLNVERKRSNR